MKKSDLREQLAAAETENAVLRRKLRMLGRDYGRASRTISEQRGVTAVLREDHRAVVQIAAALGYPYSTPEHVLAVAHRAGQALRVADERLLTSLREPAADLHIHSTVATADEDNAAVLARIKAEQAACALCPPVAQGRGVRVGEVVTGDQARETLPDGAVLRYVAADGIPLGDLRRIVGDQTDGFRFEHRGVAGNANYRIESLPEPIGAPFPPRAVIPCWKITAPPWKITGPPQSPDPQTTAMDLDVTATTLRAHQREVQDGVVSCSCGGWSEPPMAEQIPGHDHARHVAEQLGDVGTAQWLRPPYLHEGDELRVFISCGPLATGTHHGRIQLHEDGDLVVSAHGEGPF